MVAHCEHAATQALSVCMIMYIDKYVAICFIWMLVLLMPDAFGPHKTCSVFIGFQLKVKAEQYCMFKISPFIIVLGATVNTI